MQAVGSNPRLPTSLQNIFTWCGAKSNILERNKARDLALAIRDSERQGKARVEIVTDGEEPADMIQVESCGEGSSAWKPLREAVISWGHEGDGWRAVRASAVLLRAWLTHRVPWWDSESSTPRDGGAGGRAGGPSPPHLCPAPLCRQSLSHWGGGPGCDGLGRSRLSAQESLETWPALTPAGPGPQARSEGGQP